MGLYTRRRISTLGRLSRWRRLDLKQRMKEYPVPQSVKSVCSRNWRMTISFGKPFFSSLRSLLCQFCQAAGYRTRGSKTIPRFRVLGCRPQAIHRDGKSKPYAHFSSNRQGSSFYLRSYILSSSLSLFGGAIRVTLTRFPLLFGLEQSHLLLFPLGSSKDKRFIEHSVTWS